MNSISNLKFYDRLDRRDTRLTDRVAATVLALSLTFSYVTKQIIYVPDKRDIDTDNLFSNRNSIVSVEDKKRLYGILEKVGIEITSDNDNYLLLKAIRDNKNLTSKEKDLFYQFIDYFNDNPYIDREVAYTRLLNLNARFAIRKTLRMDDSVVAIYLEPYNDIVYFELNPDDKTIAHEGIHAISKFREIPRWLKEGMAELITREYITDDHFSLTKVYPYETSLVKIICDIIGCDMVLEAYTKDDPSIIYDKLDELCEDKVSKKYLDILDNWFARKDRVLANEEDINEVCDALNFLSKFNHDIDSKSFTYNFYVLLASLPNPASTLSDMKEFVLEKAYISSKLKDEYPETIVRLANPNTYKKSAE